MVWAMASRQGGGYQWSMARQRGEATLGAAVMSCLPAAHYCRLPSSCAGTAGQAHVQLVRLVVRLQVTPPMGLGLVRLQPKTHRSSSGAAPACQGTSTSTSIRPGPSTTSTTTSTASTTASTTHLRPM